MKERPPLRADIIDWILALDYIIPGQALRQYDDGVGFLYLVIPGLYPKGRLRAPGIQLNELASSRSLFLTKICLELIDQVCADTAYYLVGIFAA